MKTIVHITADFPDAMNPSKTAVVKRLVDMAPGYRHRVYSLNRVDGWRGIAALPSGADTLAIAYSAPPKGLFLRRGLEQVAAFIAADLKREGVTPALFHAHKLTMEGLVVDALRRVFPAPYLVSIQGDSDLKISAVRRDLLPEYRRIAEGAAHRLSLAPWSKVALAQGLSIPEESIEILPCLLGNDAQRAAAASGTQKIAAVFHLMSAARKNLPGLARAAVIARRLRPELRIDVFGGGSAAHVLAARKMIEAAGAGESVRLAGPSADIAETLCDYVGLAVPTLRESYGLVHIEALLAGVPIVWSRDRGVDGLFDADIAGYRCDPKDDQDIARGLVHLVDNEVRLKAAIAQAQSEGAYDLLRNTAIAARYAQILSGVLENT
jgi:glycosyltransferase involved in cell wall biosynthesis